MSARDIVLTAVGQLFGDKDPAAADRWASPTYIQHSSLGPDGPAGLRGLVATLPPTFHYEIHRVITDGDEVALHGTYHGFGPVPMVAFDIFRVEDGKLAEHWDALMPQTSGVEVDGVTEVTDLDATEANRKLVVSSVGNELHKVVAEGNFVLTVSSSEDTAFYDLYDVAGGQVTAHWQVARPIPAELPHDNGLF
ncbi:nuclear transport factor 2 family protein [Paractinoplanes atraurantiacus]|uniref:Predicted SnoaL-like aldol condensation-catalyzing enzyme n=1 Tax=Paractinoplanes atraurantiacus TaxID=1036182 RepID=A0A285IFN5_9ACTN|nr:nuclear transport factor 2 family protein [Actinoplanes atraurantiacus]SNY46810.1 Predicted SnoaL-like aldol condensation-catalyzing enzyme [Actinoplanes atraurantiacus]